MNYRIPHKLRTKANNYPENCREKQMDAENHNSLGAKTDLKDSRC